MADIGNPATAIALVAGIWSAGLGYLLLSASERPSRLLMGAVVFVTSVLLLPSGLHLPTGIAALDAVLMQPRERATLTAVPPVLMRARDESIGPARIAGVNGVLQGGVPTYLGMEGVTGADALFSPYTRRLGQEFELYFPLQFRTSNPHDERHAPLLDLWGVRWLARPAEARPDRIELTERPTAWPRAFFVDRVERHADRDAFVRRLRSDSRPFASIRDRDTRAVELTREAHGKRTAFVVAEDYVLTANTTRFTITAPVAGVVVLNEGFWPGVTATIDGAPVEAFRVNESMRAIAVSKGTWRIRFAYRPVTWPTALTLAAIGAAMLVGLAVAPGLRRRRPTPSSS
jgi:hypothetical protein